MTTLAFTGTRKGLTNQQHAILETVVFGIDPDTVIHGGATGGDEIFDAVVPQFSEARIEVYPCSSDRYLHWVEKGDGIVRAVHANLPPLVRNRIMVDRADHLIVCPYEPDEQSRGGTWSTFRYALNRNKPITLILPNGPVYEAADPVAATKAILEELK